jgi:hypothetical protein
MSLRYDEKGKFFTDFVTKTPIPVWIQTLANRIHGIYHIRTDERLSDALNQAEQFLPITDVTIYAQNGQIVATSSFLAVNLEQIIWLYPEQEAQADAPEAAGE